MLRPVRPQTGATAPEGWDREFYDYVMSLRLKGDMKYILVKQDSNGTSVSLNLQALLDSISIPTSGGGGGGGGGTSSGPYPAKITGGNPITGYNAQIYKNGISGAYTAGTIWLLENNTTSTLPPGTWVMATTVPMFDVGGSELMDDVLLEDA